MTHRSTIITRVHTDEGIVGEAYAGDEDGGLLEIDAIIHAEIEPRLIGVDGMAIERCWELARPVTFNILRDRRLGLVAAACVDTALWDAIGKALGEPLWRLWGGYRDRLPIISIGGYYDAGMSIAEEVAMLKAGGLAGMKFKVGGLDPATDAGRFLRGAGRGRPRLRPRRRRQPGLDARGGDRLRARRRRRRPVLVRGALPLAQRPARDARRPGDGGRARCAPARASTRPAAVASSWSTGRSTSATSTPRGRAGRRSGGAWRRSALSLDVRMAHHEEPQIAMHLLGSVSHGTFVECFDADRDPIWWNLVANRPAIVDGHVEIPNAPGLGWKLDEDYIAAHRVTG